MSHLSSLHFAMAGDCILSVGTAVCVFRCVPSACTNFCVKDGHAFHDHPELFITELFKTVKRRLTSQHEWKDSINYDTSLEWNILKVYQKNDVYEGF